MFMCKTCIVFISNKLNGLPCVLGQWFLSFFSCSVVVQGTAQERNLSQSTNFYLEPIYKLKRNKYIYSYNKEVYYIQLVNSIAD